MANRKIQGKFPLVNDYSRDIGYSVITIFIFTMVAVLSLITFSEYTLIYDKISDMPLWYYGVSMLLMLILHDFYFYCTHRLMHHPRLYRYIHKVHHTSTNPSPWTAYAFHPLEAVVEAGIITLIAVTIPAHRSAIAFFFVFQIIYNVYGHTGYELWPKNFHRTCIGRFINTSVAHNMHHKKFHGNYGLYTLVWDRLFGTIRDDYDTDYQKAIRAGKLTAKEI
jgi:sterol desaturase/sphingolipid hydroxylase (fatty acid hydroxylase superfamily)